MRKPRRLQLSRRKGFDLQAMSRALNGLPAVKVARPGPWGNPFVVTQKIRPGRIVGGARGYIAVPTAEDAVACFREMMLTDDMPEGTRPHAMRKALHDLRGKNLACWCKIGDPCHAAVLLDLANRPTCEAV